MSKKQTLTRADYQERRATLEVHLNQANADRAQAAYLKELGQGDQQAVDVALANAAELRRRIDDLDAAWEVSQREIATTMDAEERAARAKAHDAIEKSIADRSDAVREIAKAIDGLGEQIARIKACEEAIVASAKPYLPTINVIDLRGTLDGFGSVHNRVAACCLATAGFDLRQMTDSFDTRQYLDDGLDERLATARRIVLAAVRAVQPAEERA